MSNWLNRFVWSVRPKRIYGLIGPPGSGKSFRAFLLADEHKIQYIIDDGLLIKGQKIIAGKSAKREKYYVSAVKRAIFHETRHAREVRRALIKEHYNSLLIIATSDGMFEKIIKRLHLPRPKKIIRIEDIATQEEIEKARQSRVKHGKHVMPIPLVEVKKKYPNIVLHAIHFFVDQPRGFFFKKKKKRLIEKTIVKPMFRDNGNITISETAIVQMVSHCIAEYSTDIRLIKVSVIEGENEYSLVLNISVGHQVHNDELTVIQNITRDKIKEFTGMEIGKVDIIITEVKKRLRRDSRKKS
jgi:ABC-type dipeptide/oligopeptide/nickel transport system ATPase component